MSDKQHKGSFVKQAFILASAGIFVRLIGFLYRLPLTDMIGNEGNGIYGRGYSIYTFFLILSSAGLPAAISKMVSERVALGQYKNAHKIFKISLLAAFCIGLVAAVALALSAGWIADLTNSPRSLPTLLSLSPTLFFVALLAVFRGYFQGMNNSVPTALSQTLEQIFNAAFTLLLAFWFMQIMIDDPIAWGATGGTIGTGIGALAGLIVIFWIYIMAKPRIYKRIKSDKTPTTKLIKPKQIIKTLFKISIPIIIGAAIFSISGLIDMFMVSDRLLASGMTTEEADGAYGLLTGKYAVLITLPVSISTAMATAAIPSIAASVILKQKDIVKNKINISFRMSMLLSIPAAVGLGVLGDHIITMLFPKYPDGGILLQIGAVSVVFLAIVQIITGMLQAIGKVHLPVIGAAVGVLIKIPLNYFLISIPEINVAGAVISSVACYIVAATIDLYFLKKAIKIKPDMMIIIVKPLIASIFMGMSCYVSYTFFVIIIKSNTVSTLLSIGFGVLVYLITLLFVRGLLEEDIRRMPKGDMLCAFLKRVRAL